MFSESLDAVVCDPFRFLRVANKEFHFLLEIREVPFNFDEILIGAIGDEDVVIMLDPLQFVHDYH